MVTVMKLSVTCERERREQSRRALRGGDVQANVGKKIRWSWVQAGGAQGIWAGVSQGQKTGTDCEPGSELGTGETGNHQPPPPTELGGGLGCGGDRCWGPLWDSSWHDDRTLCPEKQVLQTGPPADRALTCLPSQVAGCQHRAAGKRAGAGGLRVCRAEEGPP